MFQDFLRTKLYMPSRRHHLVARSRLLARLQDGLSRPLTLLSAPPGFGKTTLLSEWLAQSQVPVAWLVLDADDNDPARFWSYFIVSLQQIAASIGSSSLALLPSLNATALEPILKILVNEIDSLGNEHGTEWVLVLDDYHLIETPAIHGQLSFLLDHLPPRLHLVISTRADPPLHLARLRARDQLIELHESDLRFTRGEAAQFLNETMDLSLTSEQVTALEARTEGWIAGLQLAALSLRDREDLSGFVQAFTGSNRFVFDYLTDEVFTRQTESTQSFLIQTSILERLHASLCNALTGRADSQAMLEELERNNLFLAALDDERRWYRYHRLFADVLLHRLAERSPETLTELHMRASQWFQSEGLVTEAVNHAVSACDWERVAELIGDASESLRQSGEITTLTHWIQALPQPIRHLHPALCLTYARALIDFGQLANAEAFIQEAEHWVESHAQTGDPRMDLIRGRALALHAQLASLHSQFTSALEISHRARELLAQDDAAWRSLVTLNLAEAFRFTSRWSEAKDAYREAAALSEGAGDYTNALYALSSRGEVLEAEGHLRQAAEKFEEVLQLAQTWGIPNAAVTGYALVGLGRVRCEWNELAAALRDVQAGLLRGQQAEMVHVSMRGSLALARIRKAQGDAEAALAALAEADLAADKMGVPPPVKVWIAAQRAQVWLERGDTEAALDWAGRFAGQMDDMIYPSVPIALARVHLSQHRPDQALALLDHALRSSQAVGRLGNAIHILAVQAIVVHALGQPEQAFTRLEQAIELAEPEGYIRVFLDEGVTMARLLRRLMTRSSAPGYVQRLLEALGEPVNMEMPVTRTLVEPLSQRELEVLRLIVDGATNREIADQLILTVNTVKRHISNIFGKLHVSNRAQAIAQAHQLNLLK